MKAHKIVELGMAHVPEGRRVFSGLTVTENLKMGANLVKSPAEIRTSFERVFTIFPRSKSAKSRRRAPSPAANSRCSRWGAR